MCFKFLWTWSWIGKRVCHQVKEKGLKERSTISTVLKYWPLKHQHKHQQTKDQPGPTCKCLLTAHQHIWVCSSDLSPLLFSSTPLLLLTQSFHYVRAGLRFIKYTKDILIQIQAEWPVNGCLQLFLSQSGEIHWLSKSTFVLISSTHWHQPGTKNTTSQKDLSGPFFMIFIIWPGYISQDEVLN